MGIMECKHCGKTGIHKEDMYSAEMCEDCLDKMLEEEESDFDAYNTQKGICYFCKKPIMFRPWGAKLHNGKKVAFCCDGLTG